MHIKNVSAALLAFVLAGSVITAQAEGQKANAQAAAASKLEPGARLEFSVTGLTRDNLEKVRQSLATLTTQVYTCTDCGLEAATAGKCAPCKLDLKAKKELALLDVAPSVETASIRLTPVASRTVRYSDIEGALMKQSIQIDGAKFPLVGKARLILSGGTLENAKTIEKALVDSKLFELVKASYDAPSGEIHIVVQAKATPPMHDAVGSVINALGTKAKLSDVIWGPLPAPAKV